MSKKLTFGKIAGIIFCILAAAGTILLLCLNIYFGGQMKLVDKYYTAIERDDFESYQSCFGHEGLHPNLEDSFAAARESYMLLQDNENFRIAVIRPTRQKGNGENIYILSYRLTVYNDSESEYNGVEDMFVCRENGKWIIGEEPCTKNSKEENAFVGTEI